MPLPAHLQKKGGQDTSLLQSERIYTKTKQQIGAEAPEDASRKARLQLFPETHVFRIYNLFKSAPAYRFQPFLMDRNFFSLADCPYPGWQNAAFFFLFL